MDEGLHDFCVAQLTRLVTRLFCKYLTAQIMGLREICGIKLDVKPDFLAMCFSQHGSACVQFRLATIPVH